MRVVAYLVNRYPECSLTAIRREIGAVADSGLKVLRFAHRPSLQPLASDRDRFEASVTEYLAAGNSFRLVLALVRVLGTHPRRFAEALRKLLALQPLTFSHIAYLAVACRLFERLTAEAADHLHTHFAQSSAEVAMLTRALGGPPWSMTVHGPEDLEAFNRRRLSTLSLAANKTMAISDWAGDAMRRAVDPQAIDVRIVRMGVADEYLLPPVAMSDSGPIVCVGRLDGRKGHAVLLESLSLLRLAACKPPVTLIGDGPCKEELAAEIRRRGLAQQVTICGWLSERGVREKLDACRFLVLPSLSEGLPVAVMEAFARARPVIVTDVAAISELVRHKENGLVVAAGDPVGLSHAMEAFLALSTDELSSFGLRGRATVLDRFDSNRNAHTLIGIWREISG